MLGYVEIRFGHSTSASYPKALRAAQQFGGFQEASQDVPYNSVRVEAPQLSAEYKHLRRLWDGISGWKSAEFLIDGRPGAFHDLYTLVRYVECADKREVSPQPSRYCEKSHAGGQGWGCRYLSATEREPVTPRYTFGRPPTGWWDFGGFDSDLHFVVRKEHIREALQKEADRAGLSFCPQFDFQRVSASVDSLPDEIDPTSSSTWEIGVRRPRRRCHDLTTRGWGQARGRALCGRTQAHSPARHRRQTRSGSQLRRRWRYRRHRADDS